MATEGRSSARQNRPTRWLRGFLTAVAIVLMSGGLTEIGFRIYHRIHPVYFFSGDSYNRFRGKPNAPNYTDRLNSHGFNDREFDNAKAPGTYRILALGDSFVFATVPYRYCFVTLLENQLVADGRPVEIINMGIPGTAPPDYLALFANEGSELAPDLVLAFVFIGNDLTESLPEKPTGSLYVLELFRFLLRIVPAYEGRIIHGPVEYDDSRQRFDREAYLAIEERRSVVFRRNRDGTVAMARTAVQALRALDRRVVAAGSRFGVILMPDEMQVDAELREEVVAASKVPRSEFDFSLPNRLLTRGLAAEDISVLDLLGPFVERGRRERLYRINDSHWNIAGNAFAAGLLHDAIVANARLLDLPTPGRSEPATADRPADQP